MPSEKPQSAIAVESPAGPGAARPAPAPVAGEEHVRLMTGFADIFLAVLIVVGFYVATRLAGPSIGRLAGIALAAVAWWLSGPIVRERKFAAAGIALAIGFSASLNLVVGSDVQPLGAIVGALGAWLYWRTFKVPIAAAIAILAIMIVPTLVLFLRSSVGTGAGLFYGFSIFAIAMYWDMSDRERVTRRSDVAFWLHLAAAPLIVHSAFPAFGLHSPGFWIESPRLVFLLFTILSVVALVVDRRPILVSSLSYLAYALYAVISPDRPLLAGFMTVAMLLGGGVLVLAIGWNRFRYHLLRILPAAIAHRVPLATPRDPIIPELERPPTEAEPLRLIFGFNDIFVAIGLATFLVGVIMFSGWQFSIPAGAYALPVLNWWAVLVPTGIVWVAAEYFARHRRMALPSLELALWFALLSNMAAFLLIDRYLGFMLTSVAVRKRLADFGRDLVSSYPDLLEATLLGCLFAAALNLFFWWRHRVPISVTLAFGSLLPLAFLDVWVGAFANSTPAAALSVSWQARLMLSGGLFLALALFLDWSDKDRQSQKSDIAFWLHFAASLMIMPAAFSMARAAGAGPIVVALAFATVVLFANLINRRAPILVALPFAIASWAVSAQFHYTVVLAFCITLIAVALFWDRLRKKLIAMICSVR